MPTDAANAGNDQRPNVLQSTTRGSLIGTRWPDPSLRRSVFRVGVQVALDPFRPRDRLLEEGHEGKFALIHGDRVDSLWPDEDAGYEAGCERFGLEPFLVQQVLREEPPAPVFIDLPG